MTAENVPLGQVVHAVAPVHGLNVLGAHPGHAVADVTFEYDPAKHGVHVVGLGVLLN